MINMSKIAWSLAGAYHRGWSPQTAHFFTPIPSFCCNFSVTAKNSSFALLAMWYILILIINSLKICVRNGKQISGPILTYKLCIANEIMRKFIPQMIFLFNSDNSHAVPCIFQILRSPGTMTIYFFYKAYFKHSKHSGRIVIQIIVFHISNTSH